MNRFEEDFNNLNVIYEKYYLNEYSVAPRMAGGQGPTAQGSPSYSKGNVPTTAPGSSGGNLYASNMLPSTTSPVSDEEISDESYISKDDVIAKIDELLKEAESDGMDYSILQLGSLKRFINQ